MNTPALQARIYGWVTRTFGAPCFYDLRERVQRVVEEAIELGQAENLTKEDAQRILDRVYSRPVGQPTQEAAGLTVCLLAYADSAVIDLPAETEREILRIESKPRDFFRKKQQEKADAGTARPPSAP